MVAGSDGRLPSPAVRRLARRLLAQEAGGRADPDGLMDAAETASTKLGAHLSRLVGGLGYQALLRRAVHLAGTEFPRLQRDTAGWATGEPGVDAGLGRLRGTLRLLGAAEAGPALAAVFAHLVWLLVTFIGQDLTTRTLRQVWPEVRLEPPDTDPEEATT